MLRSRLIRLYANREMKRANRVIRKKGIPCKIFTVTTNIDTAGLVNNEKDVPNSDPFNIQIDMQNTQYAVNKVVDENEFIKRKVYFLKRMGDMYHENELLGDNVSLRNDYVAYISNTDEVYAVGTIIEIEGISSGRFIIHRVFKHREYSKIKRYLLSKEFNGISEVK